VSLGQGSTPLHVNLSILFLFIVHVVLVFALHFMDLYKLLVFNTCYLYVILVLSCNSNNLASG
jgi:hypothetical protein